jgi:hypothetical protein
MQPDIKVKECKIKVGETVRIAGTDHICTVEEVHWDNTLRRYICVVITPNGYKMRLQSEDLLT